VEKQVQMTIYKLLLYTPSYPKNSHIINHHHILTLYLLNNNSLKNLLYFMKFVYIHY